MLEVEREENKRYVTMIIAQDEVDRKVQRDKDEAARQRSLDLLAFQRV